MKQVTWIWLVILMVWLEVSVAGAMNGFDLSGGLLPENEIHQGGPPRDGIPSLDEPKFITAAADNFLKPGDRVLGIVYKGETRAYPISILNWHEIVNDRIQGDPVAITYCPLCGTGLAYRGEVDGKATHFGVSGLLYNSDVLLYDRETESLWSQILSKAVTGPMKGQLLKDLPVWHTSWKAWVKKHPNTTVLSIDTGFNRDYSRSPYAGYGDSKQVYFPVSAKNHAYHPKERVLGVTIGDQFKAYPFIELARLKTSQLTDKFAGNQLTIDFDFENRDGTVTDQNGKVLSAINGFWFAWYAFHPDTEIFKAK